MNQNESPIGVPSTTMSSGPRSTARPGGSSFADLCLAALPHGCVLNLGAGYPATPVRPGVIPLDLDPRVLDGSYNGVAADVTCLPFASGVFDGALLKDVLEHVPDPVRALGEVHRVCRPGAVIIVTVPRAVPRAVWADPSHLRGFTAGSLRWTAELSGWEPVGRLDRMGSIPGAGRFPMVLRHAHQILRLPVLGHLLGTNWLMTARRSD